MNMDFKRKLPTPKEVKEKFPLSDELAKIKQKNDEEIQAIIRGDSKKLLLIIGPCSSDREDAVLDYMKRLKVVYEKVKDVIFIVPRVYTNKPRTTGEGYKGLLHQPDPTKPSDMLQGIIAIRKLHMDVLAETGFSTADEMLYPENHRYLSDLLSYVAVGARSVENQQHRLTASGINIPVGMKNPTSGDLSGGWEVESMVNPLAHAILRGNVNKHGESQPNYHYEDMFFLASRYDPTKYKYPAVIVDCNHNNSGKKYLEQIRIAKEVLHSASHNENIDKIFRGLIIESYIEDGNQKVEDGVYGKSITDPCLGFEKTEKLILELAEMRRAALKK
jgi:3-deoxy-7-phosphoheptulonate synthase